MFDVNLMKYFYNPDYEKDPDVLNAWYLYVIKFLPLVNKQWRDSVSSDKLKEQQSMFLSITISDEALVRWFIELWLPIIKKRMRNEWKDEVKTGKTPHDTNANINMYTIVHQEIEIARKHSRNAAVWNQLFWMEVTKRHENLVEKSRKSKISKQIGSSDDVTMSLPGLNESQEYLASFPIDLLDQNDDGIIDQHDVPKYTYEI